MTSDIQEVSLAADSAIATSLSLSRSEINQPPERGVTPTEDQYMQNYRTGFVNPPSVLTETLTSLAKKRELAKIQVDRDGGLFELFKNKSASISFGVGAVEEMTEFVIVESENPVDLPPSHLINNKTTSKVYHCLPCSYFHAPVCLAIQLPVQPLPHQTVTLLYNDAAWDAQPQWGEVGRRSQRQGDPSWHASGEKVLIWVEHFCAFIVVIGAGGQRKEMMELIAYTDVYYDAEYQQLEVEAGLLKSCDYNNVSHPLRNHNALPESISFNESIILFN